MRSLGLEVHVACHQLRRATGTDTGRLLEAGCYTLGIETLAPARSRLGMSELDGWVKRSPVGGCHNWRPLALPPSLQSPRIDRQGVWLHVLREVEMPVAHDPKGEAQLETGDAIMPNRIRTRIPSLSSSSTLSWRVYLRALSDMAEERLGGSRYDGAGLTQAASTWLDARACGEREQRRGRRHADP